MGMMVMYEGGTQACNAMFKKHIIEVLRHNFSGKVAQSFLDDPRVFVESDYMARDLIYHIDMFLASYTRESKPTEEVLTKEKSIEVPWDWYEAFKERWFPKWLLKKKPIVYKTIVIRTYETRITKITKMCPHVDTPKDQKHFQWIIAEDNYGKNF